MRENALTVCHACNQLMGRAGTAFKSCTHKPVKGARSVYVDMP